MSLQVFTFKVFSFDSGLLKPQIQQTLTPNSKFQQVMLLIIHPFLHFPGALLGAGVAGMGHGSLCHFRACAASLSFLCE